jgi:hypothetical protein
MPLVRLAPPCSRQEKADRLQTRGEMRHHSLGQGHHWGRSTLTAGDVSVLTLSRRDAPHPRRQSRFGSGAVARL